MNRANRVVNKILTPHQHDRYINNYIGRLYEQGKVSKYVYDNWGDILTTSHGKYSESSAKWQMVTYLERYDVSKKTAKDIAEYVLSIKRRTN